MCSESGAECLPSPARKRAHRALQAGTPPLRPQLVFLCFSVSFLRPALLAGPVPVLGCLTVKWVWASARKKAFGCRSRQAKRSACPTRGWVKPASPDRGSTDGSSALRTAGGLWGYPAYFRILSPPTHFGFQAALASAVQRPHTTFVVWVGHSPTRTVFAAHGGSQAVTGWSGLPPSVDVPWRFPTAPAAGCTCGRYLLSSEQRRLVFFLAFSWLFRIYYYPQKLRWKRCVPFEERSASGEKGQFCGNS